MDVVNYYSSSIVQSQPNLRASAERRINLKTTDVQAAEPPQKTPLMNRTKAAIVEGRLFSGIKRRLKPFFIAIGKAALRRPWIKRTVLAVLNSSPQFKNRLYRLVWKDIALAPRAMRVYTALSTAIPTHNTTHNKGKE